MRKTHGFFDGDFPLSEKAVYAQRHTRDIQAVLRHRGDNARGSISRVGLLFCAMVMLAFMALYVNRQEKEGEEAVDQNAGKIPALPGPTQRIAVLPAFVDFECSSEWRRALNSFDARVQAELLSNWDVEVLDRAGLSTVAFEGKLRAASDVQSQMLRVLPADVELISVFDMARCELRIYVSPIRGPVHLGSPMTIKVNSPSDLRDRVPIEAARLVARAARLGGKGEAAAKPTGPSGRTLSVALVDFVSVDGRQSSAAVTQAPLLRAMLEQTIASGEVGNVRLLERDARARLLEEQAYRTLGTTGASVNAANQIGRMQKADLVLLPVTQEEQNNELEVILFAIEATTGRIQGCVFWRDDIRKQPDSRLIRDFLIRSAQGVRLNYPEEKSEEANQRYRESQLLVSLPTQWQGLRMSVASESQIGIRLADAVLGLVADDPRQTEKAIRALLEVSIPAPSHPLAISFVPHGWHEREIDDLRKSGQLASLRASARCVFELPLQEICRDPSAARVGLAAEFWNRMGEYSRALAETEKVSVDRLGEEGSDEVVLEIALAQMGLGHYAECIATLSKIDGHSWKAQRIEMDAYRALGDETKELAFLWDRRAAIGSSADRLARLLDLAARHDKGREALQFLANESHGWARDELFVQFAVIRARLAVGQTDLAASDAQCVLLNARRKGDNEAVKEAENVLARVGAPALDHLFPIGDYLKLPPDCVIHLIHDETVPASFALATAKHLAGFWQCPVHVWPVKLNLRQFSFFQPLSQAIDSERLHHYLKFARLPRQRAVTCVLLTQEKFFVADVGDVYSTFSARLEVLSNHYFAKFAESDRRPLPLITAIAASGCYSVRWAMEKHLQADRDIANDFAPLQPDVFCNNGSLIMDRFELGVSARTAKVAGQLHWSEIQAAIDADVPRDDGEMLPGDRALLDSLSRQLENLKPTVVVPERAI